VSLTSTPLLPDLLERNSDFLGGERGVRGGGKLKDDGDHAPGAAAAWTVEDVGAERPAEELGPGDGASRPSPQGLLGWGHDVVG
jgi:hypothetical protein